MAIYDRENWPDEWSDPNSPALAEYRQGFLTADEGCRFVFKTMMQAQPVNLHHWSDSELSVWGTHRLKDHPGVKQEWLQSVNFLSGLAEGDWDFFRAEFGDSLCNSSFMLTQYNWPIAESVAMQAMMANGVDWKGDRFMHSSGPKIKVDQHCVFQLPKHNFFWPMLHGKRILVVSGYAPVIVPRLRDPEWLAIQGCSYSLEVVGGIHTPNMHQQPKAPYWNRIVELLVNHEWDIALMGCGSLVIPIGNMARRLGRKAIDIGKMDNVLSGAPRDTVEGLITVPGPVKPDILGLKVASLREMWVQ